MMLVLVEAGNVVVFETIFVETAVCVYVEPGKSTVWTRYDVYVDVCVTLVPACVLVERVLKGMIEIYGD